MGKKNLPIAIMSLAIVSIIIAPCVRTALSTNSWQVKSTQVFETKANSNEELSENVLKIVEDEKNIPEQCRKRRFGTTCSQETQIKVVVETTWTIIEAEPIDSKTLTTQEFATSYPDIQEPNTLTNESNNEDKLVAQRILYERGMLSVPPTGFLGHLTMMAITHLQNLKFIYDEPNRIGPRTISELNNLKNRMEEDGYLEKNPLPPAIPELFYEPLKNTYLDHSSKTKMIKENPGYYKSATIETPFEESIVPFINYFGEIKIAPREEIEQIKQ